MPAFDLAIFDFDGTLADSRAWFIESLRALAPRYGLRLPDAEEMERWRGLHAREVMDRLRLPMWKVPSLAGAMRRRMREDIDRIALFEGIDPMLQALHAAGIDLAIVSSNSAENVRRVLGAARAAEIRAFECGASLFGKRARISAVARRLGHAPERTVYVGDEVRDAEAATAAAVAFVGVAWGFTSAETLQAHSPRPLCRSADQIRAAVLEN